MTKNAMFVKKIMISGIPLISSYRRGNARGEKILIGDVVTFENRNFVIRMQRGSDYVVAVFLGSNKLPEMIPVLPSPLVTILPIDKINREYQIWTRAVWSDYRDIIFDCYQSKILDQIKN